MNIIEFLKGKKTYIIAVLFLGLVLIPVLTGKMIPEAVFGVLAGLGLGFFRTAIQKISGNKGWKTYVAAGLVAVISIVNGLGMTLPIDIEIIYSLCGVLGIVGIRKAVADIP